MYPSYNVQFKVETEVKMKFIMKGKFIEISLAFGKSYLIYKRNLLSLKFFKKCFHLKNVKTPNFFFLKDIKKILLKKCEKNFSPKKCEQFFK